MQPNDTTLAPYAVPYDFDFSAFVDADYTKTPDGVTGFPAGRRTYKGLCYEEAEFREVFDFYKELRSDFFAILRKQGYISTEKNSQIIDFINQFYAIIKNSETIKKEFMDVCETKKLYSIPEI